VPYLYLNNAATSYPKLEAVRRAVLECLEAPPCEPGRTGGGRDPAGECRRALARLFAVDDPSRVILLPSATVALNVVLRGLLRKGGHAVTTTLEHNSVLRPLAHIEIESGATCSLIRPDPTGRIRPDAVESAILPETRVISITHVSNVTGAIQPIVEFAEIASRYRLPLLVDAAQSAGAVPLNHRDLPGRVFIAAAGHKGLFGPAGTGVLVVPDAELPPLLVGGTGVHSENPRQPDVLPLHYEAGTPNLSGIAGLAAGVASVLETGVENLGRHRAELVNALRAGLSRCPGILLSPLPGGDGRAGIVSFVHREIPADEMGYALREGFEIETRSGLHCAPKAAFSTEGKGDGSVRVSVGPSNTMGDVESLVAAVTAISERARVR